MSNETDIKSELGQRWVSYRPEIRVIDCTIRDGGLMNDHHFADGTVEAVYRACVAGGIDYMEVGYKGSRGVFSPDQYGAWKFSSEDDIRRIVGENDTGLKISVMADVDRTDHDNDIPPRDQSVVDMVRVACYVHQVPGALELIKDAHAKGYETCVNLMAVSVVSETELDSALKLFAESEVGTIYLVDSFGSLFNEQVRMLAQKYLGYAKAQGKEVGLHAHNNQQLAFANTIEAITLGVNLLDGSLAGLGRGAGNCPTEMLVGFLRNPKYHMRPLLSCIQDSIEPLRAEMTWGPSIPYMITGQMNEHPRAAMKWEAGDRPKDYVGFYDSMIAEE
ncbi:MAG: aldolase catalytic domain-containing protein [Planctomycetota bacterium]